MSASSQSYENSADPPSQLEENLAPVKVRYVALPSPLPAKNQHARRLVADDGFPCRRCLQDAKAGDSVDLIGYDPFPADAVTPYRGLGPVFVHADNCEPFKGDAIPDRQLQRTMAVRAYDENHMMKACEVVQGSQLERVSGEMLADEKASYIMVHNAKPGCFAFKVERA